MKLYLEQAYWMRKWSEGFCTYKWEAVQDMELLLVKLELYK